MHSKLLAAITVVIVVCAFFQGTAQADVYGAIRGSVSDESRHPAAGVTVTIKTAEGASEKTRSDPQGRYAFPRVAFDTYTVSIAPAGFAQQSSTITVTSGNVAVVDFRLSKKILARVVTRASGVRDQAGSINIISRNTIATLPGNGNLAHVTETVPGIVPFSFNEPVARGFHGVTYEIDGVPMPQTASAQFAEVIDPRDVDRLEVFTGAIPAEFGGERAGAVIDIVTKSPGYAQSHAGALSLSAGGYGSSALDVNKSFGGGPLHIFFSADERRTQRGLDAPTFDPLHDNSSQGDEFVRALYAPNARDSIAFDLSNQYAAYQIPIDTNPKDPLDPFFSLPGTDDNQHEYDRFANITFNHLSSDGKGYVELAPWYRYGRVTYLPDAAKDLAGGSQTSTAQDRAVKYVGVTSAWFRSSDKHNVKMGITLDREEFNGAFSITLRDPNSGAILPPFSDDVQQAGSETALYVQDQYRASRAVTVNGGLRYDHSTGFVGSHQLSPRLELNAEVDPKNVVHFYYGRLYAAPALEDVRRDATVVNGTPDKPVYDLKPERDSLYEAGFAHVFSPLMQGRLTAWGRNVSNVLDTTQLGATPIFTLFNSAVGQAQGVEVALNGQTARGDSYYLSYGLSQSLAKGISGGTFLFSPASLQGANSFALEDHDQANTLNAAYTKELSPDGSRYATVQAEYGSGFPVQFENGLGRLPVHWTANASVGRKAPANGKGYGWEIEGTNLLDHKYLLKVANGFNTTQYAAARRITVKLTAALP
ncbi:MAG: TonB-dependent receptor [Candidatus Eremiobacteraeota bacterium]|nr:TonB-dependent receptor [Candidatus Eremiobacteraeota bacterium]MBC5827042.1 TonB-dependent receptor [Candidatus Eremiobacteraeota bacterium]